MVLVAAAFSNSTTRVAWTAVAGGLWLFFSTYRNNHFGTKYASGGWVLVTDVAFGLLLISAINSDYRRDHTETAVSVP